MTRPERMAAVLGAAFLIGAIAVALHAYGATRDLDLYRLFLATLLASVAACWAAPVAAPLGRRTVMLALIGPALIAAAVLLPSLEARGFVHAAIGWSALWVGWSVSVSHPPLGRFLLLGVVAFASLEAVLGILQVSGGFDVLDGLSGSGGRGATGTFINRNHFAGFVNLGLAVALGLGYGGIEETSGGRRPLGQLWLLGLLCTTLGVAVLLSTSRGGILSMVALLITLSALLAMRRRRDGRSGTVPAFQFVAILAAGAAFGLHATVQRFAALPEEFRRVHVWRDTVAMIAEHPWGVGPGMFRWRFGAFQGFPFGRTFYHAHNDYLEVAAEWGILLGLAFCVFIGRRWWRSAAIYLRSTDGSRRAVALACVVAVTGMGVHSGFDFNLHIPANLATFMAVIGVGWAQEHRR